MDPTTKVNLVEVPNVYPHMIDYCRIFPEKYVPNYDPLKYYKPIPKVSGGTGKSVSEMVWGPIDNSLEKRLRGLGFSDKWNDRLRGLAKAGVDKGGVEGPGAILNATGASGDAKKAASAAIRAAVQLRIPF